MIIRKQLVFGVLSFLFIVFVTYLCVIQLIPPSPLSENAAPSEFSAARAIRHIEAISQKPHRIGTPELAAVRDYILEQLKTIGFNPSVQNTFATRHSGDVLFAGGVANIIARLQGTESDGDSLLIYFFRASAVNSGHLPIRTNPPTLDAIPQHHQPSKRSPTACQHPPLATQS